MGLDMCLKAERYVSGYDFNGKEAQTLFRSITDAAGLSDFVTDEAPSGNVSVNCAYWRKANAIHAWFVRECQGGIDNCEAFYIDQTKLAELGDLCESLLESRDEERAARELPPASGFFFGPTDIDEWYWQQLEDTVRQLDRVLELAKGHWVDFYYRASW